MNSSTFSNKESNSISIPNQKSMIIFKNRNKKNKQTRSSSCCSSINNKQTINSYSSKINPSFSSSINNNHESEIISVNPLFIRNIPSNLHSSFSSLNNNNNNNNIKKYKNASTIILTNNNNNSTYSFSYLNPFPHYSLPLLRNSSAPNFSDNAPPPSNVPILINGSIFRYKQKFLDNNTKQKILNDFTNEMNKKNICVVDVNTSQIRAEFVNQKKVNVFKILHGLNKYGVQKAFIEVGPRKEKIVQKKNIKNFVEELSKEAKENNEFHSFIKIKKAKFAIKRRNVWNSLFEKNLGLNKFPKYKSVLDIKDVMNKDCMYYLPNISAFNREKV